MDDRELEEILAEIREKAGITNTPAKPSEDIAPPKRVKSEEPEAVRRAADIPAPKPSGFETKPFDMPKAEKKANAFNIVEDKNEPTVIAPPIRYRDEQKAFDYSEDGEPLEGDIDNGYEDEEGSDKLKKGIIIGLVVLIIIALITGVYFGFIKKDKSDKPTKAETSQSTTVKADEELGEINPLTGEGGYNASAIGKRPVAVVVENEYSAESVRPQWGINKADIVMEAETEFSTRMLFFWADYTNMPDQIGPTRSARPPFIHFSNLFNAVFIHAGLSHSKGDYVGADTVFENEGIDHINLLRLDESGNFFGRDTSRGGSMEHTGYLNGNNTEALLQKSNIKTELNTAKFSQLKFNKKPKALSESNANTISFLWSDPENGGHCPKTGKYRYDADEEKYTTSDFDSSNGDADVEFENLIFLLDETEYIVKHDYKSAGNSETYCDYKLTGGKGVVASRGTYINITWSVKDGKLVLKNEKGKEVKLNPGKSYIGYGSSNKGGKVTINPATTE
ncbi:MAG: DUF3048 domain-containing protein [Eubacterium sp.]|nr:DUF3048 domain-containing protein [Eubacterium sp.]